MTQEPATYAKETERVERIAVDAVLAAERALGRRPEGEAAQQPRLRHPLASNESASSSSSR